MEPGFLILLVSLIIVVAFSAATFYMSRRKPEKGNELILLQNQLTELTRTNTELSRTLDAKLNESTRAMQHQFSESAKIVRDVTVGLTRLQETNKQVVGFADQLKGLQDILKNPKQRGVLGEYYLETVLKNVLPPGSYETQYAFSDGTIVDAIVKVDKHIIPVDSKFSLENYNRILHAQDPNDRKRYEAAFVADLKNRIDETSKYVKPEENTMDFAFMFIPSEAVFYDLLVNKVGVMEARDLIEYAFSKRVIVVSPTSFLAYLQTVLQGLKNQKISDEAQRIIKDVGRLGKHLGTYDEYMNRLGKNIETTVSSYVRAKKELGKVDKDILKISGTAAGIKPMEIESPRALTESEEE